MEKKAVYGNERRRTFNNILDRNVSDDAMCTVGDLVEFTGLTRQGVLRWRRLGRIPQPLDLPNRARRPPAFGVLVISAIGRVRLGCLRMA